MRSGRFYLIVFLLSAPVAAALYRFVSELGALPEALVLDPTPWLSRSWWQRCIEHVIAGTLGAGLVTAVTFVLRGAWLAVRAIWRFLIPQTPDGPNQGREELRLGCSVATFAAILTIVCILSANFFPVSLPVTGPVSVVFTYFCVGTCWVVWARGTPRPEPVRRNRLAWFIFTPLLLGVIAFTLLPMQGGKGSVTTFTTPGIPGLAPQGPDPAVGAAIRVRFLPGFWVVSERQTEPDGTFRIPLPPGLYLVESPNRERPWDPPSRSTATAFVLPGAFSEVSFVFHRLGQ